MLHTRPAVPHALTLGQLQIAQSGIRQIHGTSQAGHLFLKIDGTERLMMNRSLGIFCRNVETDCELVKLKNVDSNHFDMILFDLNSMCKTLSDV